jgi:hypothetical protein
MKKEKKDKQKLTTQKTKDLAAQSPPKSWIELGCSRKVSSLCSTNGTHHVAHV